MKLRRRTAKHRIAQLEAQLRTAREDIIAEIPGMCDWVSNFRNVQRVEVDHWAYHYGSPCPYEIVVPSLLRGEHDPRGM